MDLNHDPDVDVSVPGTPGESDTAILWRTCDVCAETKPCSIEGDAYMCESCVALHEKGIEMAAYVFTDWLMGRGSTASHVVYDATKAAIAAYHAVQNGRGQD